MAANRQLSPRTRPRRKGFPAAFAAACVATGMLSATLARADIDVRALAAARERLPAKVLSREPIGVADRERFAAIIELPEGDDPRGFGLPRLGGRFSTVSAPLSDLSALSLVHPDWQISWSPPLYPLLDRAAAWSRTTEFRNATGLTGKDVVVGVVDTGVDLTHADLRHADGSTRVAFVIDFSKKPLGFYPDAEAYCADAKIDCAVIGKKEIDAALASGDTSGLPIDDVGHGTHVASLAAGSGGLEGKYVGSAPESTLIIAQVGHGGNDIGDASVLLAAQMVFALAESEGQSQGLERLPAVVNLSLGSDFGPHDGTSALERGLAELVGPAHPGRAIVVAAGNSAGLGTGNNSFPSPLGVHTEVNVPEGAAVRVPLVTSPAPGVGSSLNGVMYVWIGYRRGDDLRVGVDRRSGAVVRPQARGTARMFEVSDDLSISIVNGALEKRRLGKADADAAVVIIEGTWPREETFAIRLEGHGTASLWVQSGGDLSPASGALGTRFPAAFKESTVTSPASSPALIAVGATVNRTEWTDRVGNPIVIESLGSVSEGLLDSIPYFSSAGPTADERMKPDLIAPGAFVAGAMSIRADPLENTSGMFYDTGFCRPVTDCAAIDATHGVAMGTSMASPIVAGAAALLLERDPSLTQDRIRALLQAGVRHPTGTVRNLSQMGSGALDLGGTLDVLELIETPAGRMPSGENSWLVPASPFAHADPDWDLAFALVLRDEGGRVADRPDAPDIEVSLHNGRIKKAVERIAPGFFQFAVAAERNTGGDKLEVEVFSRGERLAGGELVIAVDYNAALEGFAAHGGCSTVRHRARGAGAMAAAIAAIGLIAARGGQRRREARKVRSRDRTGTSG